MERIELYIETPVDVKILINKYLLKGWKIEGSGPSRYNNNKFNQRELFGI